MDSIRLQFENCYGIKALDATFDFSKERAFAIYAPNGVMKTSFAQVFDDASRRAESRDRIFSERPTKRNILDQNAQELPPESIFVIRPYNEEFGPTEKTSNLLVDATLRKEYEGLQAAIDHVKQELLKAIKKQSGSRRDFEKEISTVFTSSDDEFETAMNRIRREIEKQTETPFADVKYDRVFDDAVIHFLQTPEAKTAIDGYVTRYNELLASSTYFKRGTFDYYNAGQIAKSLGSNGFFAANHTVNLNAHQKQKEIKTEAELQEIISKEKDTIITDPQLRRQFDNLQKTLERNATLRDFLNYLLENEALTSQLSNVNKFKELVLKSYLRANVDLYLKLMDEYDNAEKRSREIREEAVKQQTQWEEVVNIFNNRFIVPFTLTVKNKTAVMLGDAPMVSLGFTYRDGDDRRDIDDKKALLAALSTGERKAFYILNVIFEIRTRELSGQETLLIVDDIADSFDYQNKYAIIQYLRDISYSPLFKQIILTHNFDFFRTIKMRFVSYGHCRMAAKSPTGIQLNQAAGVENIFVNDWKKEFFSDPKKKIASIAFIRNIIEYTKGDADPIFVKLTSLLHWKEDSPAITVGDLDGIYKSVFGATGTSKDAKKPVVNLITEQAQLCLKDGGGGVNFENKIVMAIAIRLAAEQFMVKHINDPAFVNGITSNQTFHLVKRFKEVFPAETSAISALERVSLMTPENIHLNSFMYEPIIDMSDDHLRRLCSEVVSLRLTVATGNS